MTISISDDPALLDIDAIHGFLATCYWSPGIARERVARAIAHSLCWGVYDEQLSRPIARPNIATTGLRSASLPSQVGFARVVTDHASFAYLCDVFILQSHRGQGLSKRLMEAIIAHPALQGLRRFCLMTRDAHGLYAQFGFKPMPDPSKYMEIVDRERYKRP